MPPQLVQDDFRRCVTFQINNDPYTETVGLVTDVRDALDLLFLGRFSNSFDKGILSLLVWNFGQDDAAPIAATFFYLAWVGLDVIEITGTEVFPVTGITAKWAYLALIAGFVGLGITALTTLGHLLPAGDPLAVRVHHIEEDV